MTLNLSCPPSKMACHLSCMADNPDFVSGTVTSLNKENNLANISTVGGIAGAELNGLPGVSEGRMGVPIDSSSMELYFAPIGTSPLKARIPGNFGSNARLCTDNDSSFGRGKITCWPQVPDAPSS